MRWVTKAEKLLHEIAHNAAAQSVISSKHAWPPGDYISRLSEEKRAILRELKSEDIADANFASYYCTIDGKHR